MNGELAQYFTLATHTTARLRKPQSKYSVNATRFLKTITFDGVPGMAAWARHLADIGADRVWLAVPTLEPEAESGGTAAHHSAAFAGGLRAGLLTAGPAGNLLWQAQWQVGDRQAAHGRIWVVAYSSHPVAFGPEYPDPKQAIELLDRALGSAEEFSVRHDLRPWRDLFAQARLHGAADRRESYRGLFPVGWRHPAGRRLARMAQRAWVFGGMGSWNDLGAFEPDQQPVYERISRELFAAIMRACVAAANADPQWT